MSPGNKAIEQMVAAYNAKRLALIARSIRALPPPAEPYVEHDAPAGYRTSPRVVAASDPEPIPPTHLISTRLGFVALLVACLLASLADLLCAR